MSIVSPHIRRLAARVQRVRDVGLIVRAGLELHRVRRLLSRRSLPEVIARLEQPASAPWTHVRPERIRRCVDTVLQRSAAARRSPCLFRSLLLYSLLHRHGAAPELYFGIRRRMGELVGHCWLLLDGRPVMDAGNAIERYAVTFSSKDHVGKAAQVR
jgi:hypothetical protein